MNLDISSIMQQFQVEGQFLWAEPYGSGHLHDTFRVAMTLAENKREPHLFYILQKINHSAFGNPPQLMDNIVRITSHIRKKLEAVHISPDELKRRVLTVVHSKEGQYFFKDGSGCYWRVYDFVPDTCSYDSILEPEKLYQAAYKFGEFLEQLNDLPHPPLHEAIAHFHDGLHRFDVFRKAVSDDVCHRVKEAKEDIDLVFELGSYFDVIPGLVKRGEIPLRPTHCDTKVNNVLLDKKTGEGMCVIDLDTTMMGVSLYDFGDLARTSLSTMAEDEPDLSRVEVEIPRYKIILDGFLAGAGSSLNKKEKEYLLFGAKLMTLLIGMRFLTDHLHGDTYFKIHRPAHNLDRSRRQFKLLRSIIEKEDQLTEILDKQK